MALPALATSVDLFDHLQRPLTEAEEAAAGPALDAASEAIRNAAGIAFSRLTTTVSLYGDSGDPQWMSLPFSPVVSATVTIDSVDVADFSPVDEKLYRRAGWPRYCDTPAQVTIVHGFGTVPADVSYAAVLIAAELVTNSANLRSETIADYSYAIDQAPAGSDIGMSLDSIRRAYRRQASTAYVGWR